MSFMQRDRYGIGDLLEIMALLRSPGGCPWDREQTHESIRSNFIEETYEVLEAIDNGDRDLLKEELGDVLLQVVFHARMEEEAGRFDFGDICDGICKKLITRHPHIFSNAKADTADQVLKNWDAVKKREKMQESQSDVLESVPKNLPALMRSEKVQAKAARSGFCGRDPAWAMGDLSDELEELREAIAGGSREEVVHEMGDVLFAAGNLARLLEADPEESLGRACSRFIRRFSAAEKIAAGRGISLEQADDTVLDSLWQEAKNK